MQMFEYRFIRFNWDYEEQKFVPTRYDVSMPYEEIRNKLKNELILTDKQRKLQQEIYGPADIEIPKEYVSTILINEVLNPFFVFESFCICLWYFDEAVWFATMVLIYNSIMVTIALMESLRNNRKFRKMENYSCKMKLLRPGGQFITVDSAELVPGDIVLVPENTRLPSDLILLKGNALMDESLLTGESVPVQKTSIPYSNESYCDQQGTKHTLYGGTKVI